MKKRITAVLLVVAMLMGILPVGVSAADETPTSGTCGEKLTWTLEDGVLTISGTGEMYDYKMKTDGGSGVSLLLGTTAPWDDAHNNKKIKQVIVNPGVTYIGEYAFFYCKSLTTVTISDSVAGIGRRAFSNCDVLTAIDVAEGNKTYCSLDGVLFDANMEILVKYPCSRSGGYSIPSGVTTINDYAFEDSIVSSVKIPNTVTSVGYNAFCGCKNLTSITGSMTQIGVLAFQNCSSVTDVTLLSGVENIGRSAFDGCSRLSKLTIPRSLISIGDSAFNKSYMNITDIYYGGSEQEWAAISIGTKNEGLTNATIHYNSTGPENGETEDNSNNDIVIAVRKYTSDDLYAQYNEIVNADMTPETRLFRLNELFSNYGITDVMEGTHYVSNTTVERWAYLNLTSNDLYLASSFEYWLNNTPKGTASRVLLFADGLVFNNEISDYLDFTSLADGEYPAVTKYKDMLYDFMDATSERIEIQNKVKLISDLSSNVTNAAKIDAENVIDALNSCATAEEENEILEYCKQNGFWAKLAKSQNDDGSYATNEDGLILWSYKLDESSGFGQFAKAMGTATKTISIVNMGIDDIMDLLTLDSKLATYTQYQRFLSDIVKNTDIPYQLRGAASQILDELDEGYLGEIKDIAIDILEQTNFNKTVRDAILKQLGVSSLASWLSVIKISSFFINQIADIGNLVKKEAQVEGYAYLANAFTAQLEASKRAFQTNPTEKNAWDFYYNYNILYMLRYKGEEAYLAMSKVKGIASYFTDFGYSLKEDAVKDTLSMLETKCKFNFDEETTIPESCQFAAKAVINCPVNVDVYTQDGTLIATLKDGVESDTTNEYGRFAVVFQSYTGEFAKVICLNSVDPVNIKMTAVSDGLVDYQLVSAQNSSAIYTFDKVKISTGNVVETTSEINGQNNYIIYESEDDEHTTLPLTTKTSNEYVRIESITVEESKLTLDVADSKVIEISVLPKNASNTTINWVSTDENVVTVKNGTVTAVGEGTATIFASPTDSETVQGEIKITVRHIHNFSLRRTIAATCTEGGYDLYSCTCGETEMRNKTDALGHNTKLNNVQKATCTTTGYTGNEVCTVCGELVKKGSTISATGHTWDNGVVTKEPTATTTGVRTYTCTVCGDTKTESIPATGTTTPVVSQSYDVSIPTVDNGIIIISPKNAIGGQTVTVTATPDEGYELDTLTVTDAKGNELELKDLGGGKYSFKMPYSKVTVNATFTETEPAKDPVKDCAKDGTCPAAKFTDVDLTAWYHDGVHYCISEGLMNGTSATTFEPLATTNRAMLVTILYRLEGEPSVGENQFTDVAADEWYTNAVTWAADNGIVKGYGDGTFGPEDTITREQMATILHRYAAYKGHDVTNKGNLSAFIDAGSVSDWAKDAMTWAVGAELINGVGDNKLEPEGDAQRAQIATILYRFCENIVK